MTPDLPAIDPLYSRSPFLCPHKRLWAEVLSQLIQDARNYWNNCKSTSIELEQAFDDVVRCGPMTRHACRWLEIEPMEVTRIFLRWCEGTHKAK